MDCDMDYEMGCEDGPKCLICMDTGMVGNEALRITEYCVCEIGKERQAMDLKQIEEEMPQTAGMEDVDIVEELVMAEEEEDELDRLLDEMVEQGDELLTEEDRDQNDNGD
jgi:hypothetical protein